MDLFDGEKNYNITSRTQAILQEQCTAVTWVKIKTILEQQLQEREEKYTETQEMYNELDFVLITFYVLAVMQFAVSIYIWFAIPFIWCVKVNAVVFTLYNLFQVGIIGYCSVQELIVHDLVIELNELG